jgi:hypothetical protein
MAGYLEIVWSGVTYDLTNQDNVNTYLTKLSYIQSSFNPTAITTGNITASGTLAVTGASTLTGNTSVGGNLAVTGTCNVNGINANGAVNVGSTLSCDLQLTVDAGGIDVTGNSVIDGDLTTGGLIIDSGTPQTLTCAAGLGVANVSTRTTLLITTGTDTIALANGAEGQYKEIIMKTDAGDGTLLPNNCNGFSSIIFTAVGHTATLKFQDGKWNVMSFRGATVA